MSGPGGQEGAELARGWFEHSPFIGLLGMRLVELTPDRAIVEMPFRPELATAGDIVHGGAIGALMDSASAAAVWSNHDPADGVRWGTVGISVNFLSAGRGQALRADARVTRRGRSVSFCRVEVSDADGRPVAEGLVTYRLG